MAKTFNENAVIRGRIRRAFAMSPIRGQVLKAARREYTKYNKDGCASKKPGVEYQCETCNSWVSSTRIDVDHVNPVIDPVVGFVDWNTFVARVFCGVENLKRICEKCHDEKTSRENIKRNTIRWNAEIESTKTMNAKDAIKVLKKLAKHPEVSDSAKLSLSVLDTTNGKPKKNRSGVISGTRPS